MQYCPKLFSANFEGNPISKAENYREKVFSALSELKILDDVDRDQAVELKTEDYEIEVIHNSVRESAVPKNKSQLSTRPSTAQNIFHSETSNLTEEVFSGNPLKAMRFRRRKLYQGDGSEDIMNLIREFKVEEPKTFKQEPIKPFVLKNKNITIRSSRKDEFYETK